jgi:predicted RND superfamily exporter protein
LKQVISHILKLKWLYIIAIGLLTFSGLFFASKNLSIDNSLNIWFLEDNEKYQDYLNFQNEQGSDEIIVAMIPVKHALDTATIRAFSQLHQQIDTLPYVASSMSIGNMKYPVYSNKAIKQINLYKPGRDSSSIESVLSKFPVLRKRIHSEDFKKLFFYVQLIPSDQITSDRASLIKEVESVISNQLGSEFNYSGAPVLNEAFNQTVFNESNLFAVITVAVLILLLFFLLPSYKYIPLAFLSIVIPVGILLGIMSLCGVQLNMITMLIPTILMIYGISDSIHIISTYHKEKSETLELRETLEQTLRLSLKPCFFTTLSTIIGYFALYFSPLPAFQHMGIFASLGILISFVMVYAITFIGFSFMHSKNVTIKKESFAEIKIRNGIERIIQATTKFKKSISIGAFLFIIGSIFSISQIEINTDSLNLLGDGKEKTDLALIEKELGGSARLQLEISKLDGQPILKAELDSVLDNFQLELGKKEDITEAISIVNFQEFLKKKTPVFKLRSLEKLTNEQLSSMTKDEAAFFKLNSGKMESIYVNVLMKEVDTKRMNVLFSEIESDFKQQFPNNFELKLNGFSPVFATLNDYILTTQIRSFGIAFICSFIILLVLIKNFKLSLLALIPNLFPISIIGFCMYLLNIDLEVATAMLAPIVLGISMDDTIHLMHKFKLSKKTSQKDKIDEGMRYTGSALITTTISLVIGFSVIGISGVSSVRNFGILCAVAIVSALIADLFILPAMIKSFERTYKKSSI